MAGVVGDDGAADGPGPIGLSRSENELDRSWDTIAMGLTRRRCRRRRRPPSGNVISRLLAPASVTLSAPFDFARRHCA